CGACCGFDSCRFFFFSFLMVRSPPISTLFPYTTLFRSFLCELPAIDTLIVDRELTPEQAALIDRPEVRLLTAGAAGNGSSPEGLDRKSTRLNSSHVKISYAVFCLKKKKRKKRMHSNQPT